MPVFFFISLLALAPIPKKMDSVKEAPRTSQNVDVPSDVSSHRTTHWQLILTTMHHRGVTRNLFSQQFEYRTLTGPVTFHRQDLLQDRLTDLIRGEDGQAVVSQDIQNLVVRVLSEIEIWLNRGEAAMTFEALTPNNFVE